MFKMLLSTIISTAVAVASYDVVPVPSSIEKGQGEAFILSPSTEVVAGEDLFFEKSSLQKYILETVGIECTGGGNAIALSVDPSLGKEEYVINIDKYKVSVRGGSSAGVFYGVQTLRKSLPVGKSESVELPAVVIKDSPRYPYRGMMLDCARHFFDVGFVKEFIDILALHNMNRFHWHLTDDQGWRLPVAGMPELTEKGGFRSGTVIGNNSDVDDGIRYGGYYTEEQIRDIVEYAALRHIEVIPEVDMPGHMCAALACHPELGCTGGPYQVGHKWGVYNDVLCVGNPESFEFVKKVLDSVVELFPSKYIHIGGDETPTVRWEKCPKCSSVKRPEGESLQGMFTKRVAAYLHSKGKTAIGWDELIGSGIDTSTVIMSWRGTEPGQKAAAAGHRVVMTPLTHCYFDYYQTEKNNYEPSRTGMWPISVEKVYSLTFPDDPHIKGIQANLWTEYIGAPQAAEYMVLPRAAALSEVQWSREESRDMDAFKERLTRLTSLYDALGYKYAKHFWPDKVTEDRWHIDQ